MNDLTYFKKLRDRANDESDIELGKFLDDVEELLQIRALYLHNNADLTQISDALLVHAAKVEDADSPLIETFDHLEIVTQARDALEMIIQRQIPSKANKDAAVIVSDLMTRISKKG